MLCGKQAIDNDMNATGPDARRAAGLGPGDLRLRARRSTGDAATVTREVDGGLQSIRVGLPAVVTVDLRLNEPRYA